MEKQDRISRVPVMKPRKRRLVSSPMSCCKGNHEVTMLRCSLAFLLFTLPLRLRGKVVVWVVAAVSGVNGEAEEANECRDEDAVKCAIAAMSHWQS